MSCGFWQRNFRTKKIVLDYRDSTSRIFLFIAFEKHFYLRLSISVGASFSTYKALLLANAPSCLCSCSFVCAFLMFDPTTRTTLIKRLLVQHINIQLKYSYGLSTTNINTLHLLILLLFIIITSLYL